VVWVDNGPEVYSILYPLSKENGDWLWGRGYAKVE